MLNLPKNQDTNVADMDFSTAIQQYNRAGKIGETVKFYEPKTVKVQESQVRLEPDDDISSFFERTRKSTKALKENEISLKDVAREVPGATRDIAVGTAEFIAPSLTKFFKTTGSIIGEGLAYALYPNVRAQYTAGDTDLLPTIHNTTQADLAKFTFAAGLETAIFRSFPNVAKMKLKARGGVGALQGVGFAIAEGLAKEKTAEDIMKSLPTYGVGGATLNVFAPYLLSILKAELGNLPKEIPKLFKSVDDAVIVSRNVPIKSLQTEKVAVPVSTPNSRYQAYLKSQGYEPYIPDEALPEIQMGPKPPTSRGVSIDEIDAPAVYGSRLSTKERISLLSPEDKASVLKDTRVLFGRGMDYQTAQRTALVRFEAKTGLPEGITKVVPEEATAKKTAAKTTAKKTAAKTTAKKTTAKTTTKEASEVETEVRQVPDTEVSTTKVPGEQLPVGEGATKTSRLEARMNKALDDMSPSEAEARGFANYQQMNKSDQIRKAAEYVESDPDFVMDVLEGRKNPPNDVLYNSLALAMREKATLSGDSAMVLKAARATRAASLRSTRAGQEISILSEADPDDIVGTINEIYVARQQRLSKKIKGGKTVENKVEDMTNQAEKVTKIELKIDEAKKLLNDILC